MPSGSNLLIATSAPTNKQAVDAVASIVGASSTPITSTRQNALAVLINKLTRLGIWAKLDFFYDFLGAEDENNAKINLKSPGSFTLTKVGTLTQSIGYGYKGDGTSGCWNTGWIPGSNGVNYQTTSCHLGTWELSNIANTNDGILGVIGTGRVSLVARSGAGQYISTLNINSTTNTAGGSTSTSIGHTVATRTANTVATYKNGSKVNVWSFTAASATPVTGRTLYIGARNNAGTIDLFSNRLIAFVHGGGYLSPDEVANFTSALNIYKDSVQSLTVYASSVSANGIPVGNTSGVGSAASPLLTIDGASTSVSNGGTILLNGNTGSPTVYQHASRLIQGSYTLDSVSPNGASLRATSAAIETIYINPGPGGVSVLGDLTIDANNNGLQCVEVASTPSSSFRLIMNNTRMTGVANGAGYGLWTSNQATYANIDMNNVSCYIMNTRGMIQHWLRTNGYLSVNGGRYTITAANSSVSGAFIDAYSINANSRLYVTNTPNVSVTIGTNHGGTSLTGIACQNITPFINGLSMVINTAALAKSTAGLTIRATNDTLAQNCYGFRVSNANITIRCISSAAGIWVGYDGTRDTDYSNGMTNGGLIEYVHINGADAASQAGGFHGIAIASWSDTRVANCVIRQFGIGIGSKEASPTFTNCAVYDCTSSYIVYKGARPGTRFEYCRTVSTAGNTGVHVEGHYNDGTNNSTRGATHSNNIHINDGGSGVIFVSIDAGEDVTMANNIYYNRSGTLNPYPWRYNGVSYSTFEDYRDAVEPTAQWYDPDA